MSNRQVGEVGVEGRKYIEYLNQLWGLYPAVQLCCVYVQVTVDDNRRKHNVEDEELKLIRPFHPKINCEQKPIGCN